MHASSELYENSYLINMFILNMVYKFKVSNLWSLILSLATIGIMKGKEGETAGSAVNFLVFYSSVKLFEVWDDWLHLLVRHNYIFLFSDKSAEA